MARVSVQHSPYSTDAATATSLLARQLRKTQILGEGAQVEASTSSPSFGPGRQDAGPCRLTRARQGCSRPSCDRPQGLSNRLGLYTAQIAVSLGLPDGT